MSLLQTERNLGFVFQVLARCPKTSDEAAKQRIVDTLIYQHGSLRVWYYTEADSGEVLKRDRRDWSAERIVEIFSTDSHGRKAATGVPIAFYVHYAAGSRASGSGRRSPHRSGHHHQHHSDNEAHGTDAVVDHATLYCHQFGEDAEPLSVDYFDAQTLTAFLATRENKHNVMLQKFVRGTSDHASMVQVVWSPHRVLTMQRQNNHSLGDLRVPVYQRANTFDNTTHLSHEVRPTAVMSTRLDVECRRIVAHIANVEQRVVTRMVAFFSFDTLRHPVLLFVSEVQITSQPATPESVRLGLSMLIKRKLCMVSPQLIPSDVVFPDYAKIGTRDASPSRSERGSQLAPDTTSGGGHARLSIRQATSSTAVCHALHDAKTSTFDEEMAVLDTCFESAYEARNDRGSLSVAQRRLLVAQDAFRAGAIGADTWEHFSKFKEGKTKSVLQARQRFYVADPLWGRQSDGHGEVKLIQRQRSFDLKANREETASGSRSKPASPVTSTTGYPAVASNTSMSRPASALSGGTRPASAASRGTTVSLAGGARVGRPGSSLILHSNVRFCRGGGGGLYLMRREENGNPTTDSDHGEQIEHSSAASGYGLDGASSFSHLETAMAHLRSPGLSPSKPERTQSSAALKSAASLSLDATARIHDMRWDQWSGVLKSAAEYRSMVAHSLMQINVLSSNNVPLNPTMELDAAMLHAEAVRSKPDGWTDVEFLDPTTCTPEQLSALKYAEDVKPLTGWPVKRCNLWRFVHTSVSEAWMMRTVMMHRDALEAVDEFANQLQETFHSTNLALGGAPWCNIQVPFCIALTDCPSQDSIRALCQSVGVAAAQRSSSKAPPPPQSAELSLDGIAVIPWQVAAWFLWSIVQPSVAFPMAIPTNAEEFDASTLSSSTPQGALLNRQWYSKRFVSGTTNVPKPNAVVHEDIAARALERILQMVSAIPFTTVHATECGAGDNNSVLRITVHMDQFNAEKLRRILASLRSFSCTLQASWCNGIVECFSYLNFIVAESEKQQQRSRGANRHIRKNGAANEWLVPNAFVHPSFAIQYPVADDMILALPEDAWRVVVQSLQRSLDDVLKRVQRTNVEWPPRISFTP